jgi:transposase InsO family protein
MGTFLAQEGLVVLRRRRRASPPYTQPFQACHGPNDVWCADFKGWFRTGDGVRCDPLTLTDAFSRVLLRCVTLSHPTHAAVRPVFEEAFCEYGLPRAIRTDNGPPFASAGAGGLSRLSVWWVKLGIIPERIAPGHPEQNGWHERMHRTLKAETAAPPAAHRQAQQAAFDRFQTEYNTVRPPMKPWGNGHP